VRAAPWQNLDFVHVIAIKAALQNAGMSPTSINATLAAVRKIAEVCVRMNLMERDEMLNIQDIVMLRVHRLPAGRGLRIGELEAIFRAGRDDKHPAATRGLHLPAGEPAE